MVPDCRDASGLRRGAAAEQLPDHGAGQTVSRLGAQGRRGRHVKARQPPAPAHTQLTPSPGETAAQMLHFLLLRQEDPYEKSCLQIAEVPSNRPQ